MRKLKIVTALLLLLSIFSPGLTIAQTAPPGKTELSVDRKGVMRDPTGKVVDWRLFPFTTYADDCTKDFVKGTATKRPGKMCVDSSLLVSNDLDKKGSAQRNKLLEYMAAEPKVRRKPATLVRAKRGRRSGPTVVNRTTTVTTPPTSEQLQTMEDEIFKRLASDADFRNNLAARMANDTEFVKALAAKIPVGGIIVPTRTPTPTPAGAGPVDPNQEGYITAFWNWFTTPLLGTWSPWHILVIALITGLIIFLLFSKKTNGAVWLKDEYNEWQTRRRKRQEAKIRESRLNLQTPSTPLQTTETTTTTTQVVEEGDFVDELETLGPPLVPTGPPDVGDETAPTVVTTRTATAKKVENKTVIVPPAKA